MKLFEETKIGNLTLKNRLWRSATWLAMANEDGYVTDAVKEQYKRLAEGGVGSIIVEFTNILEEEKRILHPQSEKRYQTPENFLLKYPLFQLKQHHRPGDRMYY